MEMMLEADNQKIGVGIGVFSFFCSCVEATEKNIFLMKSTTRLPLTATALALLVFLAAGTSLTPHPTPEQNAATATGVPSKAPVLAAKGTGALSQFPTLHPLAVHFPLVLLLLAPLFQIIGMATGRADWKTGATLLAVLGALAAFIAAKVFQPHTPELPAAPQATIDLHYDLAMYTLWASGIAAAAKIAMHLKRPASNRILDGVAFLLLTLSATLVTVTGHYGSKLTHLYGIGPKGEWLEEHKD
ncbi:MAG: hypothetical protein HY042_08210 [Spirochaetia bacterium]|nr:hypothetical protein [Spirochaetia bacterium]